MKNNSIDLQFFFFREEDTFAPIEVEYKENIKILQLESRDKPEIDEDTVEMKNNCLEDMTHYGLAAGLYWIWKNVNSDYIGFSLDGNYPIVSESELDEFAAGKKSCLMLKRINLADNLRETYRSSHYDFDMRLLKEIIKKNHPTMNDCFEDMLKKNSFIIPTFIMHKNLYKKICVWLFSVLEETQKGCRSKVSDRENNYLGFMSIYLLNLYISHYEDKIHPYVIDKHESLLCYKKIKDRDLMEGEFTGNLLGRAQSMIDENRPEDIVKLLSVSKKHKEYEVLNRLYENYRRQKRYYPETDLDKNPNILLLAEKIRDKKPVKKNKILVFRWNSINDSDMIKELERYGFEIDFLGVKDINYVRQTDSTEVFCTFLDQHDDKYDFVFSVNFFDELAEACYSHNIPYLCWVYDSPANLGTRKRLGFDTTNVFLFDSEETYREQHNIKGAHLEYLPLAANIEKYDAIEINENDREKYSSEISFIGQLYDNKLNEYMQYMSDYQKAFFNAMIDYNVGKYDTDIVRHIVNMDNSEWFSDKRLVDAVYREESKGDKYFPVEDKSPNAIIGKLILRTNQTITNRERLILISMLSNHWDFKLYSTSSHEVFNNVKECGTIDYYTNAPKVFKLSKINLNITLKTIISGIPLRCLDIMGCGGFLLSNYQRDFDEHFKDGENVALFNSIEEAYDKCKYYLEHESERIRVARCGYETVQKYYNYKTLITQMIEKAGLNYIVS